MKKLIPLLFLLFFLGCDRGPIIEDFKIEGVGLGDSLLDVMTKDEILEQISDPVPIYSDFVPPNLFYEIYTSKNLKTYYRMSFFIYADDEKFKIYGIFGDLNNKTLDRCNAEQEKITQEFKDMFPEAEYSDYITYESNMVKGIFRRENTFLMPDGEELMTQCHDVRNDEWWGDKDLTVSLLHPELSFWLSSQ